MFDYDIREKCWIYPLYAAPSLLVEKFWIVLFIISFN